MKNFPENIVPQKTKCRETGLGLPIIKSMIELMGGSIQVESRQGIGTKFTIDLLLT